MAAACIDTHILIWGIQRKATSGQEEMISRTGGLLTQFANERVPIIVPSIVFGEFLLGLPVADHGKYQELINRRFMVVPYDLRASLYFSMIWHKKRDEQVIDALKNGGLTRHELRADTMILATALAAGATCVYGHDTGVRKLAEGLIEYRDISEIAVQTTLLTSD